MKLFFVHLIALTLCVASAHADTRDATDVLPEISGRWQATACSVNDGNSLPIDLVISADGTVTGTLGGATLEDGRFKHNRGAIGRTLHIKTDYIIVGKLNGALVANGAEPPPPLVMIPLTWRDGYLTGTVHGVKSWLGITMPTVSARVLLRRAETLAAPTRDAYRIELSVIAAENRCDGQMELRYYHRAPQPSATLRLRLDPNLSTKQSLEIVGVKDGYGRALEWRYLPLEFGAQKSDRGVLEVVLAQAVRPTEVTTIAVAFRETGKHLRSDMLVLQDDPFPSLDAWYPKAMSPIGNSWSIDDDRVANYDVTLELPDALVVASSGCRLGEAGSDHGRRTLHLNAQAVRGFTIYGSPQWQRRDRRVGDRAIGLCLPSEASAWADRILDAAVETIGFYEKEYGPIPCRQLDIACLGKLSDPGQGSSAGCNVVTIFLGRTLEHRLRYLMAHELAHQYFGAAVGSRRDGTGWVPMGLALMMDEHCARSLGCDIGLGAAMMRDFYFRAERMGFDTTLSQPVQAVLRSPPPWSFGWNMALAHGKAYAVSALLRDLLGSERFQHATQRLLRERMGGLIDGADLIRACEAEVDRRLDWFAADWIDGRATFDYAVRTVRQSGDGWDVTIERVGSGRFPAQVEATTTSGERVRRRVDYAKRTDVLHFPTTTPLKEVRLDPDHVYPDLDPINDTWQPNG